jgi:hypothetical protein
VTGIDANELETTLFDDHLEEEVLEPMLEPFGGAEEEDVLEMLHRHADVDEEPEGLIGDDLDDAQALDYQKCVDDVVNLAASMTIAYVARETGDVPSPDEVAKALRIWLDPRTIAGFGRTLVEFILGADHLPMWERLAGEFSWGEPLLWLAQRVLCLPASEAQSERTVGQVRRTLGDYASRMSDETLLQRVQMAMLP